MQKIRRKKQRKTALIGVAFLLAIGAIAYLQLGNKIPWAPTQSTSDSTSEKTNDVTTVEQQTEGGKDIKENTVTKEQTPQTTTDSTDGIKVVIAPPVKNGNELRIQSTLYTVTNSGECTLTISGENLSTEYAPRIYTAGVQALSSYSTCKGFTVNISDYPAGKWDIKLDYKNGTESGSATTSVTI